MDYTSHFLLGNFINKIIFRFGFLSALDTNYHIRFHWIIMWAGYFTYIYYRIRAKFKLEIWEIIIQLFIICYYIFSIVFVQIDNYGFRVFIPVTFIILAYSFMGLDSLIKKWRQTKEDMPDYSIT